MDYPYVNIHTHARVGVGIEVVSVVAPVWELPQPPYSIGIHPWHVDGVDIKTALYDVAKAGVSAIGEVGLDYAVEGDRELQAEVFRAQLAIACERGLPVVLHCVKAFEPVMKILADYTLPAVIFHGFVGSREQAEAAVGRGYYLSFGERSLRSPKTREAMGSVPRERMFLETDESTLSIIEIYRLAAKVLGVTDKELRQQIFTNYTKTTYKRSGLVRNNAAWLTVSAICASV
jgi:TatD DNase family protein